MQTRASKRRCGGPSAAAASAAGRPAAAAGAAGQATARSRCCSFAKYGETFVEQPFYECVTCELTLEKGTGICRACARTCHAGHDVGFVGRIKAYCDCGRSGCDLAKDTSAAATALVDLDESSEEGEEGEGGAAFVDPRLSRNYADKSFWDDRYASNKESDDTDEWLVGYSDIEHVLKPQLQALTAKISAPASTQRRRRGQRQQPRVLMLGCGDSEFSADLYDAGFPHITNIDISAVCIEMMREREGERRPEMAWEVADCTDLSQFPDDSFDAVIDKTMLDALCCSTESVHLVPKMLEELGRVLVKGGPYVIISFSLESAKASFEQAVLSEAVFASFKSLAPTVSMVVKAAEDNKRNVVATASAAAADAAAVAAAARPKRGGGGSRRKRKEKGEEEGEGEAQEDVKPVEFAIFFLGHAD